MKVTPGTQITHRDVTVNDVAGPSGLQDRKKDIDEKHCFVCDTGYDGP